jgi:Ca2+-binding EF-hand superfamily protein
MVFNQMDQRNDGLIGLEEFLQYMNQHGDHSEEVYQEEEFSEDEEDNEADSSAPSISRSSPTTGRKMGRTFSGRVDSKVFLEEDLEENSECGTVSGMVKHQYSLSSVDSTYDDLGFESHSSGRSSRTPKEDGAQSSETTKPALFRRTPQLRERSRRSHHVPEEIEDEIRSENVTSKAKQVKGSADSNSLEGARSLVKQSDESPKSVSLTQSTQGKVKGSTESLVSRSSRGERFSRIEQSFAQQPKMFQEPQTRRSELERAVPVQKRVALLKEVSESVYEELDSNQQGDVSEEEFVEVLFQKPQLLKTLNAPIPRSQSDRERVYRRLFNSMNRSQSGYLTYEEVESYVSDQQQLQLQPRQSQSQSQSQSQESQQEQRQGQAGRDEAQTVSLPSRQPPSQLSPSSSSQRNPSRSRSRGRYDEEEQDLEQDLKQQHSTAQGRGEIGREQRPRQDQGGQGQDRRVSSRSSSPDKLLQLGRIPSGELDENVFVEDDSNSEGEGEGDESPQRQRSRVFGDQSPSRQPPPSQRPSYADMFKLIDRNSDGRLSLMEFMQALRRHPLLAEVSSLLFHSSHLIDSCTLSFSFLFLSFQH